MSESIRTGGEPPFFVVSWVRLFVLSLLTAQLYQLYWLYRVWAHIQARAGRRLQPVAQVVAIVVSMFFLLRRVRAASGGVPSPVIGEALVLGFLLLRLFDNAPAPVFLVANLSVFPLLALQSAMVSANFSATGLSGLHTRWSRAEVVWVVAGVAYNLLHFAEPA